MGRKDWLTKNIEAAEALLEELYYERDARAVRKLAPTQVEQTLGTLKTSVYQRHYYEQTVKTDEERLQRYRQRSRERWQRKREQQAQQQTQQARVCDAKMSFTLVM